MTGRGKNEDQIKRSKTIQTITTKKKENLNEIKKTSTMKQMGLPEEPAKLLMGKEKKENHDSELLEDVNKAAEKIPVLLPAVKIVGQEQPVDEMVAKGSEKVQENPEEIVEEKIEETIESAVGEKKDAVVKTEKFGEKTEAKPETKEKKVVARSGETAKEKKDKSQVQKKSRGRGTDLEDAMDMIRELHESLDEEERSAYTSDVARGEIQRTRYDSLSASDLRKRAKEAVKRRKNAQKVMEYDSAHFSDEKTYTHIDQATLKKHIAAFKKLPGKPYDMATDDKFLANLEKNYQLCDAADHMKHWLEEASDQGYMPKGEDMAALQEKIAVFSEVKQYMDHQKDLMKNPYYQYFAKQDVSYTDKQLTHIAERTSDPILKNYLMNVHAIRSLRFVRSKGMKSAEAYAKEQGKRRAEILGSKLEKRMIMDTLSDKAMQMKPDQRFSNKDYDARFTEKKFQRALKDFQELSFKNLHFAGVKDMTEHFDENQRIFDRVHDLEHLMMVAIDRGLAPSEQEMLKVRAKMETLIMAEQMVTDVQRRILTQPEAFLNEKTYKDLEDSSYEELKKKKELSERHEPPKFGQDLNRYFRSLLKEYQEDHENREKNISKVYGLTHPVLATEGENAGNPVPGRIPEKELERRSAEYQKNAYRADYMRNLETDLQDIHTNKVLSVAAVHAKRTGRPIFTKFGRSLNPFVAGKSVKEIIRVVDIMQTGTEKEKEKLWKEVSEEVFEMDLSQYDSRDPSVFYRNAAMRARLVKIANNLGGSSGDTKHYVKDPEFMAKVEGYFDTSCAFDFSSALSQMCKWTGGNGFWYEDFFTGDANQMDTLLQDIEEQIDDQVGAQKAQFGEGDYKGSFRVGDDSFSMTQEQFILMQKSLKRVSHMYASGLSQRHSERAAKGIRDHAVNTLYDELKGQGYHKDVTDEQIEEMKSFYRKYNEQYVSSNESLIGGIKKQLKNTVPDVENQNFKRTWMISNIHLLENSTYGREKTGEAKKEDSIEKSAALYKGLLVNNLKMAAPERQERALAIEEMFRVIMNFDIARLHFRSYPDLIRAGKDDPDRFKECHAVTRLAMEAVNFLKDYRALRNDEEVSCKLNAVNVDEIAARCDLLMSAEVFFDGNFLKLMESPELKKSGISLGDALHLSPEELEEKMADAVKNGDSEKINFWANVISTSKTLDGFDIGIPATVLEEHFRKKKGLLERSRVKETQNVLNGSKRVLDDSKIGRIDLSMEEGRSFTERYGRVVKDKGITVSEREEKLYNKRSRLFVKRVNHETLQENGNDVVNDAVKARTAINLKNRMAVGEERLADLSQFMKKDAASDNKLAERYADEKQRFLLMDEVTREMMSMNLSLRIAGDEEFAKEAGKLEKISQKALAYDRLLKANPDYLDHLRNRRIGTSKTDLETVEERLNHMLAISDYYRARKVLLSDHYYILHYEEELSNLHDEKQNTDQRRVAELLRLVSICARRLTERDFRSREEEGLDTMLSRAELLNRQQAYLTGRPDLTKADPEKAYKTNRDIESYLKAAGLDEVGGNIAREELCKDDLKKSFPQAEKYRTEAVGNYFDAVKAYVGLTDSKTYKPQEEKLYNALKERTKNKNGQRITSFRFHDPVTGETWDISTSVQRLLIELVKQYGVGVPEEEILDTMDGLLLTQKEDLDLSDEKTRFYARERWLDSMQKLFYMEYNAMKQYENTYGTLVDEMPMGCFFASLGSGLKDFAVKNRFGQDVAQLCDKDGEKRCLSEGKEMTVAQLLVKYGKIPQDVAEDCYQKNVAYYQTHQVCMNNFLISPAPYAAGEFRAENDFLQDELRKNQYTKDHVSVSGPKLSMAEGRKLWKEARKYEKDRVLTGGQSYLDFQKDKLDLYTQEEKKELKKDRAKDLGLMHFYQFELDERREKLLAEARTTLGEGISDELLKHLIEFHPGMLKEKTDKNAVDEFYGTVKQFAGIGIPKEEQDKVRKEAAEKLFDHWTETFRYGCTAGTIQELMGYSTLSGKEKAGQARTNENQILEGSKLYIGEVRHRMYESVLRLFASDQDSASLLSEKKQKNLADRMKTQLRQEILRALVQNKDYLELKDIGSRRKSYQERMFEELRRLRVLLGNERKDLFSDILDQNEREVLKYFGIPCPDEIKEEKKAEEKTEKKAAAEKTEEKKEEKIGDNLDGEIQKQVNLHYEMPEIDYKKNVQAPEKGEHVPYESQGDSTYCWACVMSGLMNAHAGKKVSDLNEIRKKPLAIPAFEESGIEKKENYDAGVDLVSGMYDGTVYGNPAIFGDYIFNKLPDTAVRTAIISREPERLAYAKRRFLETLSKNLEKGPVGFLHAGHFVLVRGLEGDKLKVNDSMSKTPDQLVDYDKTVSELFAAKGQQLELVWLEDLKGKEKEIAEEFNLNYDAEKKEFALKQDGVKKAEGQGKASYDQPKNEQTILHRNGVEATAQFYDDVVYSSVYVPKKLTQNTAEKNAEKVVKQPVEKAAEQQAEKAAEQQVEKAAEQQAEKIVEKSRDDVAEGLVQDALGAAMKELEQEELKKDSSGKLPVTPAEYYAEVKRIVMVNKDKLSDGFARVSAMAPSDYFAVGSQENRFMSRQIGMLSYFGKLKDSELNEAFYALMVNTKTATVRQKTLKAREYERLFEQILDFDIRKLNIKSIRDAFSSECMDAAVMASALFDCHPSMMRDYEDLLKDPAVRTSLSEDEFKEIKARWEMIHSNFSWVSDAPKYEETIRENKIDIDEVLSMSTKQLMDLVNHTSDSRAGDPKLNEFYVWILTQKTMWASEGYEGPGDDVEALLQKKRTSDRYMLPEDKSYAEDAKKKLRARLAEDEGKIFDRNIETSLEPTLEKQLKKVEEQFKGTGVSKSALSDMKKTTKAVFQICEEQNNAVSKSTLDALKETSKGTIDIRGIAPLLRPVKLNKDNQPATEEDMRNRKLNEKDVKNLSTNRLSDRVEFLERVVGEARDIMFTVEELKDHKFILKNRERAIKHMRLMHNLLNLYTYHENYFLNQAPAETRDFMFMLASASEYVNFQAYHIQNALQEKGLGAVPLGGSSSLLYTLQYDGFFDYKTVVSVNKKLSKLGPTAAQFYYGNIIGLKPIIDTEDPDELDIPAMLEDARLEAIEDAKKRKITDSVLSSASRMILAGELPKGTETYDDKDNERIMAKYLDLFASKNKAKLKNKSADRKKLKTYIDEYKSKNKVANQEGLIDE